jgi:nitrite reductase/ring-hydroxylating ferredoxin subunit
MLSPEENRLLTETDPGTPMGETLRRYWQPALLSWELPEPDCPPVQVKLLGEHLVAFRDSSGRVGMLEEFCPHRGASLWLGRNEEGGLRCVFHGWKFDVEGRCLQQMNEPESFAQKVWATAYPTEEFGGIIWVYMGPREKAPPPPKHEWTLATETHRYATRTWEECNWLQALEGGVDTAHVPILHRLLIDIPGNAGYSPSTPYVSSGASRVDLDFTDYGYRYAGIRPLQDGEQYVRAYHFVMPSMQIRPQQLRSNEGYKPYVAGHYWVPMDDHNCMSWNWIYSFGDPKPGELEGQLREGGTSLDYLSIEQNFRKRINRDGRWGINRRTQRSETFTGIEGINTQDHAVQESMGPISNRSREHLGPSDKTIIALRQVLLRAVRTVEDGGDPPGLAPLRPTLRGIEKILPAGADWRETLAGEIEPELSAG